MTAARTPLYKLAGQTLLMGAGSAVAAGLGWYWILGGADELAGHTAWPPVLLPLAIAAALLFPVAAAMMFFECTDHDASKWRLWAWVLACSCAGAPVSALLWGSTDILLPALGLALALSCLSAFSPRTARLAGYPETDLWRGQPEPRDRPPLSPGLAALMLYACLVLLACCFAFVLALNVLAAALTRRTGLPFAPVSMTNFLIFYPAYSTLYGMLKRLIAPGHAGAATVFWIVSCLPGFAGACFIIYGEELWILGVIVVAGCVLGTASRLYQSLHMESIAARTHWPSPPRTAPPATRDHKETP